MKSINQTYKYFISIALVLAVSLICFIFSGYIGYRVVALILLMCVSVLAILFDILPVLIAAVLSAGIWNFFFIPPLFTFRIGNAEDLLMFLMYFVIALVNASLTYKIREAEKKARDKEEKENTIKLYNTLLSSLSHEMRTPLSTIIGAVDILKENRENLSFDDKRDLLIEIDIASVRLNRQVQNLLNMNRLEAGMLRLKRDWCDINEMIFASIQKFADKRSNHRIVFKNNDQLPLFRLDAGLIEEVIHNLILNALQYTPDTSEIFIEAILANESLRITISDNGPGFPDNEIQYAFDKFYRLPHTKPGGTGLGLSIVKGFVEVHGGKIILENKKEGGAKFTLNIPAEISFITNLKNE